MQVHLERGQYKERGRYKERSQHKVSSASGREIPIVQNETSRKWRFVVNFCWLSFIPWRCATPVAHVTHEGLHIQFYPTRHPDGFSSIWISFSSTSAPGMPMVTDAASPFPEKASGFVFTQKAA